MHYTHRDMPRTFKVPFGPWLIPVLGSLLCILLMKGIEKYVGFGFLIWTGIGQIIYFSYGYRYSKRRLDIQRVESIQSTNTLLPTTVENLVLQRIHAQPQPEVDQPIESFVLKRTHSQRQQLQANQSVEITDTSVNDALEYL